ncbi:MAG: transglutaminase domain-containing protein [Rhodanobacteraceae bacterium]|nr:transglutaminase domain-containing protein [Rhodanobacteraceae bacterium]
MSTLYVFDAASRLDQPVPLDAFPSLQRQLGLQLPDRLNPRTRELGAGWRSELGDNPTALANRALAHIRSEGFAYTLSPPPLVGAHRMDEFLFETREGFCEHYAAAFVVLMRSAGVPARVVTGYLAGPYNLIGNYWVVRNSDAHAWAEILIGGNAWVRIDPTSAIAPDRVNRSGTASMVDTFGDLRVAARAARPGGCRTGLVEPQHGAFRQPAPAEPVRRTGLRSFRLAPHGRLDRRRPGSVRCTDRRHFLAAASAPARRSGAGPLPPLRSRVEPSRHQRGACRRRGRPGAARVTGAAGSGESDRPSGRRLRSLALWRRR